MEWEFTYEDVVKAKVNYELIDFINDFRNEVTVNIHENSSNDVNAIITLLYDFMHWCATEREPEQFYAEELLPEDLLNADELRSMHPNLKENITMLGAILQRMIMNQVDKGIVLEEAIQKVAQQHQAIVDNALPS
ncbi:MAG: hypothetical protein OEL79_07310 [Chromatiales bacterium]|nr:hypothetical protein [Chromatiales bacterium]